MGALVVGLNVLQQIANATGAALVSTLLVNLTHDHDDHLATRVCPTAVAAILIFAAAP